LPEVAEQFTYASCRYSFEGCKILIMASIDILGVICFIKKV
jgi:hypothetical protein